MISTLRFIRQIVGRKLYLLAVLMPMSSLAESFGITLLIPVLTHFDNGQAPVDSSSRTAVLLDALPLPDSITALLLLIGVAFLLKAILKFSTDSFTGYLQAVLKWGVQTALLRGYTRLSFDSFASRNTGHYVNVVNVQALRLTTAFKAIVALSMRIAGTVVYFVIAALVDLPIALFSAGAGVAFICMFKVVANRVRVLSRKAANEESQLNKQFVQVLHGLKYLVATDRTQALSGAIERSCGELFRYHVYTNVARSLTLSIREPLSLLMVLGLVIVHTYLFEQPVTSIIVALLLLFRTSQSLFGIQGSWQDAMEYMGSAEMIRDEFEFVDQHRERNGTQELGKFSDRIVCENVSFAYARSGADVLADVNVIIPRNQTIAFVGHSGAGKSTLADLLTLLHIPSSGRMLIDGRDATVIERGTWRSQIGYVCQEDVVFDDTIAANICLHSTSFDTDPKCRLRVQQAAAQAHASHFIESLSHGYDTIIGDRGVALSGGQRQRLFIARELYKEPALLILDEATSALDGESERAIQKSIDQLKGKLTVVLIAHRLATIRNADYIYVLDNGSVIEEGSFECLHGKTNSEFRRMVELQKL